MKKNFTEKEELDRGLNRICSLGEESEPAAVMRVACSPGDGEGINLIWKGGGGIMESEAGVIFKYVFEIVLQIFKKR